MPAIYILAGPNGTGKTTYYTTAIEEGFIEATLPFINVDVICRDELGGYSEENTVKAENIARERIRAHIEKGESFMIESNLARQSDYDWIQRMSDAGYDTHLFFLCTSLIDINIQRVEKRVQEGGHYIPEAIVRQRYNSALTYLKGKLHTFNEAILIDNSDDIPQNVAFLADGVITYKMEHCPEWAQSLLYIAEKLSKKKAEKSDPDSFSI